MKIETGSKKWLIRKYRNEDCGQILKLFYDTVHTVNRRDYSEEQVNAWAPDGRTHRPGRSRFANTILWWLRIMGKLWDLEMWTAAIWTASMCTGIIREKAWPRPCFGDWKLMRLRKDM